MTKTWRQELRKDQKGVKECHEEQIASTFHGLFEVELVDIYFGATWCGLGSQDNLKQKRAFVQLERLMQVKFKVRELVELVSGD